MTEFELVSLFAHGFGHGCIAFLLVLIYWRQK